MLARYVLSLLLVVCSGAFGQQHPTIAHQLLFINYLSIMKTPQNPELWPKPSYRSKLGEPELLPVVNLIFIGIQENGLQTAWGCTGLVFAPKKILTAKHCTYVRDSGQTFLAGRAIVDNQTIHVPLGFQDVASIIATPYRNTYRLKTNSITYALSSRPIERDKELGFDQASDDIAVLDTDDDISTQTGTIPLLADATDLPAETRFIMTGFPKVGQNSGEVFSKYSSSEICQLAAAAQNVFYVNCTPNSGISGGPLLIRFKGKFAAVAVNSSSVDVSESVFGSKYTELTNLLSRNKDLERYVVH